MQSGDAKILLGLPPDSVPSPSQIKFAYRRKVWETHPDRFPAHLKPQAESDFKLISEAYSVLNSPGGSRRGVPTPSGAGAGAASYSTRVFRSGNGGGGSMKGVASLPFLLIIFGSLALAGSTASRAYRRQKEAHPCFNPFLP